MNTHQSSSRAAIEGLEPKGLWEYFYHLEQIPRESGNEEGVRRWLVEFAKKQRLEHFVDGTGNVIIRKPATPGYEGRSSVALQGHMDMVCVKKPGSTHNFLTDPVFLVRDGDWIRAKDTSLGADNGIAVAMIMDVFTDSEAVHGPLEAIFTVSEETGLDGAFGLDESLIRSRKLINLDSEEEGVFYIGCAGGNEIRGVNDAPATTEIPSSYTSWKLEIDGLKGGHSGAEINLQRGNAIKLAARILSAVLKSNIPLLISSYEGGYKRNVIPSTATVVFSIPKERSDELKVMVSRTESILMAENAVEEPELEVRLSATEPLQGTALSAKISASLVKALHVAPHGVDTFSKTIPGIVETSSNLAIITASPCGIEVVSSHRSSVESARDDVAERMMTSLGEIAGLETHVEGAYPSWTPNPSSPLAEFCRKAYAHYAGAEPVVTAIHAGLECGIINSKIPGMDSVSFGPDMEGVHSTAERLSISSVSRTAEFLRYLLKTIE
ncbi:aminoacyl-histidine dipeptidase [Parasphaerochaeta coccoides]|uniref:Cytosol non-specific dipeptidase n=1 Tax=Parasphaerochaeta coccoides (strain ATCC BAA-1237 / DSM 17374 / SPN1) TaxID=760011 RepID=F4GM73_PARC1|nr:aminoacyl-histidine dipeptidase [Parasphaerochaeta coccoides]AEC03049.1 aminoacyl-histidine dipeptidase [Parasphaerochaeta coccoides DSM 17374]